MMNTVRNEAQRIVFTERGAELLKYRLRELKAGEVLVQTRCSLISVGTETTLYVSQRWKDKEGQSSAGTGSVTADDQWDFDEYGSGDHWDMDRNRSFPGYALAGDVINIGKDVTEFEVGERVLALHYHADHAICPTHPAITLKIPDGLSYEEATFAVLGSVGLHAVNRANLRLGESVVIMGAGVVGLLVLQLARLNGASPLISVDLSPQRLKLARRVGADYTINPNSEDLVAKVREYTGSEGADCTIEAVGNPKVLQSCMQVCVPGSRVVVMGAMVGEVKLDMYSEFIFRELTLIASQQPRNPVQDSIYYHLTGQRNRQVLLDLIKRKAVNVQDLITHRFAADGAAEVYRLLGEAKNADYDSRGDVNRDMVGVLLDWM